MGRSFAQEGCKVDHEGIHKRLKRYSDDDYDCTVCHVQERAEKGTRCDDCPFRFNSIGPKGNSRIYPGAEFKKYGLKDTPHMGKHTLFYFLYHPWLNFTFPDPPEKDIFGRKVGDKLNDKSKKVITSFRVVIHHMNKKFYDDSKYNLLLCLHTEHPWWEKNSDENIMYLEIK